MNDYYNQPQIPEKSRNGLIAANKDRPLAALQGDATPIINRLINGESVPEIANGYGITEQAVYAWLMKHAPQEFQAASAARQLHRLRECEDILDKEAGADVDTRKHGLEITRAREKARVAQWHLERANRTLFGDTKQEININQSVNLGITPEVKSVLDDIIDSEVVE